MKTLIINGGNANTKVMTSRDNYYSFESKMQINSEAARTILIDGVSYEIGAGAQNIDLKLNNLTNKYCTYYAIAENTEPYETINLMLALPMNDYLDRDYRNKYLSYIIGDKVLHLSINNQPSKTVHINNALVYMEGAAAIHAYPEIFKDRLVGLLDLGGGTINCAIFDDEEIIRESITTLDLGSARLEKSIMDRLNIEQRWNLQAYEAKYLFNDTNPLVQKVVNEEIDKQIIAVKNHLISKKWNIERLTLFATGGTTNIVGEALQKHFKNIILSPNPVFDNATGMWLVGEAQFSI